MTGGEESGGRREAPFVARRGWVDTSQVSALGRSHAQPGCLIATGDTTVTIGSADDDVDEWLENDKCASSPVTTNGVCKSYASCSAGTQVVDCRSPGNHGFFYASNNQFLVPDQVWPFFEQFTLP